MEDYAWTSGAAPEVPGYDVGRCLGRGGSATVWLVTEHLSGTEYALKCFAAGDSPGQGDAEEAIRREVRILSVLDHEHLVRARSVLRLRGSRVHLPHGDDSGVDGDDDGPWDADLGLIMDYAAGGSLGQLVAGRGKLGPGETVTVLTPIAQALAYLHGHGFTHGDVSPGNVLFTAHGKPLLADLGVARMVADAAAVADAGTEGFRDPAPVDAVRAGLQPERDVYSLAALGWYCLTGRAPEPGAQRPPLPLLVPDVPAALAAALESGLQEDRRLRPSAAELAAAVHRSAVAEPVDLSVSVHPTVIPQLLTRRSLPRTARERRVERLRALPLRFRRPRVAGPLPLAGQRGAGRPSRSDSARHAALPDAQVCIPLVCILLGWMTSGSAPAGQPPAGHPLAWAPHAGHPRTGAAFVPQPQVLLCWAPSLRRGGWPVRRCLRNSPASPSQAPMRRRNPRGLWRPPPRNRDRRPWMLPPFLPACRRSSPHRTRRKRSADCPGFAPAPSARGTSGCWTRSMSRRRRRPWRTNKSAPALRNRGGS